MNKSGMPGRRPLQRLIQLLQLRNFLLQLPRVSSIVARSLFRLARRTDGIELNTQQQIQNASCSKRGSSFDGITGTVLKKCKEKSRHLVFY